MFTYDSAALAGYHNADLRAMALRDAQARRARCQARRRPRRTT